MTTSGWTTGIATGRAWARRMGAVALLACAALPGCAPLMADAGAPASASADAVDTREMVVLVHGLGRSRLSMRRMARTLEREGYRVVNFGYSSTCCEVDELAARLRDEVRRERGAAPRVHFVGHSLGTILVRAALTDPDAPQGVGRVVMLAPPNQGSREADRYARWLGWLLTPLPELRTDSTSTVRSLGVPAGVEIGVIAGRHDGKVSVPESHLDGETDHVSVPATHTFLMSRGDVRRLTLTFLRHGRFHPGRCPGDEVDEGDGGVVDDPAGDEWIAAPTDGTPVHPCGG